MKSWLDSFPSPSRTARRLLVGMAVAALLCIYAVEVTSSSRDLSAIWDEPTHILAGYRYWQAGDCGLNPEHPPLAKMVGTFPLLFMNLKAPRLWRDDSKPVVVIAGPGICLRERRGRPSASGSFGRGRCGLALRIGLV